MDERNPRSDRFYQQTLMPQEQSTFAPPDEAYTPLADEWAAPIVTSPPHHSRFVMLSRLATFASLAILVVAVVFLGSLVGNTMQATTAKQVIDHAVQTLEHGDFQSISLTGEELNAIDYSALASSKLGSNPSSFPTPTYGDLHLVSTSTLVYQAPNLWRIDNTSTSQGWDSSQGSKHETYHNIELSDGANYWQYDITSKDNNSGFVRQVKLSDLSFVKNGRSALTRIFRADYYQLRTSEVCSNPTLQGSETVNGRDAYVIEYDYPYAAAYADATLTAQCDQLEKQLRQETMDEMQSEMGIAGGSSGIVMSATRSVSSTTTFLNPGSRVNTNNWPKPTYKMWIDKQTSLVLKSEITGGPQGKPIQATVVTNLQVNTAIDAKQFTAYDKPADGNTFVNKPAPAVEDKEFAANANAGAKQADYPVFIPSYLPNGLVPLQPTSRTTMMTSAPQSVSFTFAPSGDLGKDTHNLQSILNITQSHAQYSDIASAEMEGKPIDVGGRKGWLYTPPVPTTSSGSTEIISTFGGESTLSFERDGAFIELRGNYSSDELVKVAAGLKPAPNSHAPIAAPQPPTIAQVRQQVKHSVYIPTNLPAGVVAEPPLVPQTGGDYSDISIAYHNHDGSPNFAFIQMNSGSAGMGLDTLSQAMPSWLSQKVTLANGSTAIYMPMFPFVSQTSNPYNGAWFIWQQGDITMMLVGAGMGKADFTNIANSMSATADLSPVELPVSPTPQLNVAPPSFKVLRPTTLPDSTLKPKETNTLAPGQNNGSGVIINYTPNGEPFAFNGLMLVEMPATAAGDLPNDPKATKEQIAGHEVSVTRTGDRCQMMIWQQDGVYFALIGLSTSDMGSNTSGDTSASMPGYVSGGYTYAQMKAVVESIK